jgi:hypothetical protein
MAFEYSDGKDLHMPGYYRIKRYPNFETFIHLCKKQNHNPTDHYVMIRQCLEFPVFSVLPKLKKTYFSHLLNLDFKNFGVVDMTTPPLPSQQYC